jgi:HK97 family phage prohead protease
MAAADNSAWDGNAAMSACKTAADYAAICAGRKAGPPDQRSSYALPHHKSPGAAPNAAGTRNALSRLPQTQGLTNRAAAQAHLEAHMKAISPSQGNSAPQDGEYRTVPFELGDVEVNGDGLTFSGYAAVFNTPARIAGWDEDFDEQIAPGTFRAVAEGQYPVLMFEHGRHPLIGTMPLGKITDAREDPAGLWIEARLTDNWLIQPVRDAVAAGALDGMSFRFTVNGDDGETWMDRQGDVRLRTLTSVSVPELGPVVFPAYTPTTASVRSVLDKLPVIGRPPAGARAATDRAGGAQRAAPSSLTDRFRRDSEALALRGIEGVKI